MIRPMLPVRLACLLLLLVAASSNSAAQHDTRGRRFWVTFMSAWGGLEFNEDSDMRLYLSSERPTTARVIYHGGADTLVVPLPQARRTVEVDMVARFGPGIELDNGVEFEPKAIEVIADDEITVYGVTVRQLSADAFMALPDDVLTNAYVVLAYPNGWIVGSGPSHYDQPSQFAVVATEDGTTVRITPSAQLNGRTTATFTVTLDRGEVYNGQAEIGRPQDVSGTEIKANKPVAVFAGNRRSSIPVRIGRYRDFLVEQLPPIEVWGREAVITPHYPITPSSTDTAVVRVLAAFDDTRWQIDGVEQTPLRKASSVEIPLLRPMHITASGPIMVAQYEHSVNAGGGGGMGLGDPFMMLIPPTEQFDTFYVFQAIEHFEFRPTAHFINVVIPTLATGSVRLDGAPVTAQWRATPKPGYSYAQINVAPGSHAIVADSAFGLYSYGFGGATSYGYPGGMLFRTLVHDFEPPDIEAAPACLGYDGFAFDSRITDSGIDSLYALPATRNVTVTIDPFTPGADTVRYAARLVDPYSDGTISMKAIDSAGRSRVQTNQIPGFTVRAAGTIGNAELALDTLRLFTRIDTCITLTLHNDGRFEQTVTGLALDPPIPGVTVTTPMPIVLAPGARVPVTLCAGDWVDTVALTRIMIAGPCGDRSVATLPIVTGLDTIPPEISTTRGDCGRTVVIALTERSSLGGKIRSVVIDTLQNGRFVRQTAVPAAYVEVELEQIDPHRDLVCQLTVIDVAGNERVWRDTVGGFTLAPLDAARDSVSIRFDRELGLEGMSPGDERCDTLVLHNYGARTLRVETARFLGNRGYSVPQGQLPIVIAPGSDGAIIVCAEAVTTGAIRDTLLLSDGCDRQDLVVMRAAVPVVMTRDGCNSVLSVMTMGAAKRTFLATPFPNPADGATVTFDIGLAADAAVSLEIVDAAGTPVSPVLEGVSMEAGLHRLVVDAASLGNGSYLCRMLTSDGVTAVAKLVVRR